MDAGKIMRMMYEHPEVTFTDMAMRFMDIRKRIYTFPKMGEDLKEKVGIKKTVKEYGIEEEDFLAVLDEMTEQAFDDRCTGTNPRYPLMSEIKQMYKDAYYGKQ